MGSLNETNPSLWVGTSEATRFHELHGDLWADVVVIGAGIAGLTTAALLKADGRRVVVVDAGRVAAGVTGYTTAKLTVLHGLIFDDLTQAFGEQGARKYADANLAGMAAGGTAGAGGLRAELSGARAAAPFRVVRDA